MLATRQVLGERGERIAERWLISRGWSIVDRRFRSGHRDIDLVVELTGQSSGGDVPEVVHIENAFAVR